MGSEHALAWGVAVVGGALGFGACAAADSTEQESSPVGRTPECSRPDAERGAWTALLPPDGVLGIAGLAPRHRFTDGETFTVYGGLSLGFLGRGETDWTTDVMNRQLEITGGLWAASESYLLVQGGTSATTQDRTHLNSVEIGSLLDGTWTRHEPPASAGLPAIAAYAGWTGSDFLLWGGNIPVDQGVTAALNFDAISFSPESEEWRTIPAPTPAYEYELDEIDGIFAHIDADLSSDGLFAWGILPDRSDTFGLFLDLQTEEWNVVEGGPGLRTGHDVVAGEDGDFFVVGGARLEDGLGIGEIWRYSVPVGEWAQIEVPDFADPRRGVWLDGKLYVFGACDSDSAYDPKTGTWELLPPLAVPSIGTPIAAGGRIFLTLVYPAHGDALPEIFIYDPLGTPGMGGAGGN